jgi:hypothetical protein
VWLNVIGWTATAVFSSSYFFKEAATLRTHSGGHRIPLGAVRDIDPLGACGRRKPYRRGCGGLHVATAGVGPEILRRITDNVARLAETAYHDRGRTQSIWLNPRIHQNDAEW